MAIPKSRNRATLSRANHLFPKGSVPELGLVEGILDRGGGIIDCALFVQRNLNTQLVHLPDDCKGEVEALLALCVQREMSELLETLPETRLWRRKSTEHLNHEHTAEEFVDVIMFLCALMVASGTNTADIKAAFKEKLEVLRGRFG